MSLSKILNRRGLAGVGAVLSLWIASSASAETVDLSCAGAFGARDLWLSIDTGANTASFWEKGADRAQALTSAATISDQQVTWTWSTASGYPGGLVESFTFDRNTGSLTNTVTNNRRTSSDSWTCSRASKVF